MYGWRARLGLIIPSSNSVMESEFYRFLLEGCSLHISRVPFIKVTEESLLNMEDYLIDAAKLLKDVEADIIIYGCTSGSFIKGKGYDRKLEQKIESAVGIKAVTTSTAVLRALDLLHVKKISVATPYPDEINAAEKRFLEDNGYEVISIKGLGIRNNLENGKQVPEVAFRIARNAFKENSDAIFISCTNFRTFEIILLLEKNLGVPVITSNQASLLIACRILGIRQDIPELGMFGSHYYKS